MGRGGGVAQDLPCRAGLSFFCSPLKNGKGGGVAQPLVFFVLPLRACVDQL
jgi:hypothetical protein